MASNQRCGDEDVRGKRLRNQNKRTRPVFRIVFRTNKRILDIGSGPGQYAESLAKHGHDVVLLDSSASFIEAVKQRFAGAGLKEPFAFNCDVLAPGPRHQVTDHAPYDAIWCSGLLAHVPISAQLELLNWYRGLLSESGVMFVNILLQNPRVFARDGRYWSYYADGRAFEARLKHAGFDVIQMLARTVNRNTYREPYMNLKWLNYYCSPTPEKQIAWPGNVPSAIDFTAYAYDRSVSEFQSIISEKGRDRRKKFINSTLDTIEKLANVDKPEVLDAGCGTGDFVAAMVERGWGPLGIDISHRMIQHASSRSPRLADLGVFHVGDFRRLPDDYLGRFDAIICITALQHVPVGPGPGSLRDVFIEFWKALKPNGIVRIDVRLGGEPGYDPDLRFIQSFESETEVIAIAAEVGFDAIDNEQSISRLAPRQNTFRRPIDLRFANLWFRKRPKS